MCLLAVSVLLADNVVSCRVGMGPGACEGCGGLVLTALSPPDSLVAKQTRSSAADVIAVLVWIIELFPFSISVPLPCAGPWLLMVWATLSHTVDKTM